MNITILQKLLDELIDKIDYNFPLEGKCIIYKIIRNNKYKFIRIRD